MQMREYSLTGIFLLTKQYLHVYVSKLTLASSLYMKQCILLWYMFYQSLQGQ